MRYIVILSFPFSLLVLGLGICSIIHMIGRCYAMSTSEIGPNEQKEIGVSAITANKFTDRQTEFQNGQTETYRRTFYEQ